MQSEHPASSRHAMDLLSHRIDTAWQRVQGLELFSPSDLTDLDAAVSEYKQQPASTRNNAGQAIAAFQRAMQDHGVNPVLGLSMIAHCASFAATGTGTSSYDSSEDDDMFSTTSEDVASDSEGPNTPTARSSRSSASSQGRPPQTPAQPNNPLAGKRPEAIADWLLTTLNEVSSVRQMLVSIAHKYGPEGVWTMLQEANRLVAAKDPSTFKQDGQQRTAGGVFFSLAKKRSATQQMAQQVANAPTFQLRPYQERAVEQIMEAGNWVVAAPTGSGKTAIFIEVSKRMLATSPRATVVVLVPTVSLTQQQTAAYQKAGFRLASDTVNTANLPRTAPTVDWFCGDKPLPPTTWRQELQRLNVIIIEAQSFANLVEKQHACLSDIELLVLDEGHHAVKQHAYARILARYKLLPEDRKPKVVGVSASPANGSDKDEFLANLSVLLRLVEGQVHVIAEDDEHVNETVTYIQRGGMSRLAVRHGAGHRYSGLEPVARPCTHCHRKCVGLASREPGPKVAPAPKDRSHTIREWRTEDGEVLKFLRHGLHVYAAYIDDLLRTQLASAPQQSQVAAEHLLYPGIPTSGALDSNERHAYNMVCKWLNAAASLARDWSLVNLGHCIHILEVLRQAEALTQDTGFECGLKYLAHRLLTLSAKPPLPSAAPPDSSSWLPDTPTASSVTSVLAALRMRAEQGPSAAAVREAAEANNRPLAALVPCQDIALDGHTLCKAWLFHFSLWDPRDFNSTPRSWLAMPAAYMQLPDQVPLDHRQAVACKALCDRACKVLLPGFVLPGPEVRWKAHPKVQALVRYLQQYSTQTDFHGIIFCRTRQAAHHVGDLLKCCRLSSPDGSRGPLAFVDHVCLFVGHGTERSTKTRKLVARGHTCFRNEWVDCRHHHDGRGNGGSCCVWHTQSRLGASIGVADGTGARGMNVRQQQAVLQQFKEPGRQLLVATNAAEEGLDIPSCEFVIRFSPPATGIQRVQGRGRARMKDAEYMELVQVSGFGSLGHGGHDVKLHSKAHNEENVLRSTLRAVAAGR